MNHKSTFGAAISYRQVLKNITLWIFLFGLVNCSPVKFTTESNKKPSSCTGNGCVSTAGAKQWIVGSWSSCSRTCGTGTQSRSVKCVNSQIQQIADSYCSGSKPTAIQDCNTQTCSGNTISWLTSDWSACSVTCGGGTQTRTVTCNSGSGTVADSQCTATKPATSQSCNTGACGGSLVDKVKTVSPGSTPNKVDILLVLDDSSSMQADNQKLASRLSTFVTELGNANLNWRMCVTTTDVSYYSGSPIYWSGINSHILTKDSGSLNTIFQQTINDIGSGFSNDEQGIKASILNLITNSTHQCYRSDAAHSVIVISDEDERSVGGVYNRSGAQYQPLDDQNLPSTYVTTVHSTFGNSKRFAFNSIVVKDSTCEAEQDQEGSPSFIGTKYLEAVSSTSGASGSICDSSYATNLVYFKEAILDSVTEVTLDCAPYGTPTFTFAVNEGITTSVAGNQVTLSKAMSANNSLTINYKCQN